MGILSRVAVLEGARSFTAGVVPTAETTRSDSQTYNGGARANGRTQQLHESTAEVALRGHAEALGGIPAPFQVFTANPAAARRAAANDVAYSAASASLVNRTAFAGVKTFTAGSEEVRRAHKTSMLGANYDPSRVKDELARAEAPSADEVRAPEESKMGTKTIRDVHGRTIFEGEAMSKEALLAKMLKEEPGKSLAGIDLGGMSLDHRHDLSRRNMTGANIKGTQFDGCAMEGTVLAEARADKNTKFKNLMNADGLDISNLKTEIKMDGKGITIENVKSADMNMTGADLSGVRIDRFHTTKLEASGVNMSGGVINKWVAEDTHAEDMKANNVRMGGSVLHGEFKGIDLSGTKTKINDSAFIGDMTDGKAVGASFAGKNYFAGEFGKFDFSRASFKGNTDMTHVQSLEGPIKMHGTEIGGIKHLPKDPRTTVVATSIKSNGFEFKPNDGKTPITLDQVKVAGDLAKAEAAARANNTITNLTGLNTGALRQAEASGLVARPDEDAPQVTAPTNAQRPRRPAGMTMGM